MEKDVIRKARTAAQSVRGYTAKLAHKHIPAFRSIRFTYNTEIIYQSIMLWPIQKMLHTLDGGLETNTLYLLNPDKSLEGKK